VRNHWWWRPGWSPGRWMYAWHLTFGGQTVAGGVVPLRGVVAAYQARLGELPGLDLVPVEWLHVTMQDVGFADEVSEDDLARIAAAVRRRCVRLTPVRLTLGPAVLVGEGIWPRVSPTEPVRRVRAAVRAGVAEVWGASHVPKPASGFTPHVSLAYSDTDGPDEPYAATLAGMGPRSATVAVGAIQLIEFAVMSTSIAGSHMRRCRLASPSAFSARTGPGCFDCRA
jgi:2'-5' RNA ligase